MRSDGDTPKAALWLACLLLTPLCGAILYYVWKRRRPDAARYANRVSWVSCLLWTVVSVPVAVAAFRDDAVAVDLTRYVNVDLASVRAAEAEVNAIASAAMDIAKKEGDAALAKHFEDKLLPAVDGLLAKARAIDPRTTEVRELHRAYVASVEQRRQAYAELADAVRKNDATLLAAAKTRLQDAQAAGASYLARSQALAKEHNVTVASLSP
jgi:hypothetical protein